ncbi:MAG TPA: hypothetical protein VGJ79_09975 [Candidatus Dormibacteraeota bacterium]|jgi:hypothetical protein
MESVKGTPCEGAIEKALVLAHQILAEEIAPFDGARQIAWLGSADCYDFLNEVDAVNGMAGFWQEVDDWEVRQDDPLSRNEISEKIRHAAGAFIDEFGSWQPGGGEQ